ncbi:DUF2087 domain-containing protein [Kitasatospora camelliae]|uniref:DUF2087 domain-containing protein n=1 Tax=Kitasatospora camelliae TaxID=3156397 RepID=A0AAU8JU50_9ACTN
MTPDTLAGLLAEPRRLRAFAALALGADSPAAVASAAGLSARDSLSAVGRLRESGLVSELDGRLRLEQELFRALARGAARADATAGDGDPALRAFVDGGRLTGMPAQKGRRRLLLEHIADRSFEPATAYTEQEVNERLLPWCQGGPVDHVALRRYLIVEALLTRDGGIYRRTA